MGEGEGITGTRLCWSVLMLSVRYTGFIILYNKEKLILFIVFMFDNFYN